MAEEPTGGDPPATERSTAPQSPYDLRQVGIGFAVLIGGLVVAVGIPLAATV